MTVDEVQAEVRYAWTNAYSAAATRKAIDSMASAPAPYKISHLIARLFFRGIYFPNKGAWAWVRAIAENRSTIIHVVRQCLTNWRGTRETAGDLSFDPVSGD